MISAALLPRTQPVDLGSLAPVRRPTGGRLDAGRLRAAVTGRTRRLAVLRARLEALLDVVHVESIIGEVL